ncbi:MAG: cupin domain-containing protein [Candidatus Omnitrophica bacterium]|nr:cupin domain-containing protein [Candidatus Omnitrophota bacterium]
MKIEVRKPTSQELDKLGIKNWNTWECEKSTFDWTYSDRETAYVFEGKVKVKTAEREVSFGAGDLVVFPKGLACTWTVQEPIRKVYKFG